MPQVRVRFAPSPTGVLHLGGARTALFNYLFARHTGGQFLLRIEDTDKERSTEAFTQAILEDMAWMGMRSDEEPVVQSSRLSAHREALQQLIDSGKVYKCYCTPEEREAARQKAEAEKTSYQYDRRCLGKPEQPGVPFVWRFQMPTEGETVVDGLVQGRVVTPNSELEDLVIARQDGSPLYNFVVVIDDAFMGITHVVRGKDHLSNTPKQVQIYRALGYPEPVFAHLPLILGLSKRLRSAGLGAYRDAGYLPSAVSNYIARLGWSHGDQEIFTEEELIEKFDLADVNRAEGALNLDKMAWLNQQHIQMTPPEQLAALLVPFLQKAGFPEMSLDHPRLLPAVATMRARASTLVEMAENCRFYFVDDDALEIDEAAKGKHLTQEACAHLRALADALASTTEDWTEAGIETAVRQFIAAQNLQLKHIAQPCRVALVGAPKGPGLYETMAVLGPASSVARLRLACSHHNP